MDWLTNASSGALLAPLMLLEVVIGVDDIILASILARPRGHCGAPAIPKAVAA